MTLKQIRASPFYRGKKKQCYISDGSDFQKELVINTKYEHYTEDFKFLKYTEAYEHIFRYNQ